MADKPQSKGRDENAAAPLGERPGLASDRETKKVGRAETRTAGPDGPRPPPVERKR
jgi:hypothetical protein